MMNVVPYNREYFDQWNAFVMSAENGTFLFHRNFMEYHSDRFQDASIILLNKKNQIEAVFPANVKENKVYSHQGLTYGGLILKERKHIQEIIRYFYAVVNFYKNQGIQQIVYKPVPNYISLQPCDAEHFIMNIIKAETTRVDTSFVTHLNEPLQLQERRKRSLKKAEKLPIKISMDNNFDAYWKEILEPNLWERYQAKPVHSLEEIKLLHSRFPENILQANAYLNNKIVAGITLFVFPKTAHCQYISSIDEGRESGAIDVLFYQTIQHFSKDKIYFSMGTSNNDGNDLNIGVAAYKESFDAKIYTHFHYLFSTDYICELEKFI
ncbi:MAG: hypothetical protein KatS3mg027_0042 [Bacteroidia bacterium]|nr:MAG: hypothetical protein KatS3mg027_0042 [Bacteroidia bacterium]